MRNREEQPQGDADGAPGVSLSPPGGLLDVLAVGAVVLDERGRIVLWSPQAEQLFGYSAAEALGRYAAPLLVPDEHIELVLRLFDEVMREGKSWAGVFPIKCKDGKVRAFEFRNMRLHDDQHATYALGLVTDRAALREIERDLAFSTLLIQQSPMGVAVMDTDLRYVSVNPALTRLDGVSEEEHLGRTVRDVLPPGHVEQAETVLQRVLETGEPVIDHEVLGGAMPGGEGHAWSVSTYRLDDAGGQPLGLSVAVTDITERHQAAIQAEQARQRLSHLAEASVRIGTTLDLEQTARELAEITVPELADIAAVDVLDAAVRDQPFRLPEEETARFRALALATAYPTVAADAADPPGQVAHYSADRLVTRCVATGQPVAVPEVQEEDLRSIGRDEQAAGLLSRAGVHSYLAVPLIARGEVLGALDLKRTRNPKPFDHDDTILACELAGRAAVCIDNARLYRQQHNIALTLQRSMLPTPGPTSARLRLASRYQPAGAHSEIGGDWFDVLELEEERTALVVGDVMGSGVNAAATMGRLRTATQTLARLALTPADVLSHLDQITTGLDPYFATCLYAVYDPQHHRCHLASAGHLPPVLVPARGEPRLIELPVGTPLGIGGGEHGTVPVDLHPGDLLVLYTDGLVETRRDDIEDRLQVLLELLRPLAASGCSLEETCDRLLESLRSPENHDDVALLLMSPTE
ncbi:SpoIIE family protein phosphatase [Streptomyces oryzae]|uniref:SpoIIE family protein phosphatase n=1 Tax=Streptomyces oryzae TaxID=1434886 RepID=A0ABS3XDX3_9ACTN|nr:SpoIIE family protein phosphatase [Streptomyces oryzae]MBO8193586.1 SpoIIE family protein phosphatase [Streptomyces oryzae]